MQQRDVAARLQEIGLLLELAGGDPFRIRSYQNVARMLEGAEIDLERLVREDRLTDLKGVGKAMADKIATLMRTGSLPDLEALRARVPPGLLEMLRVPDLGPRKVKLIHDRLGIDNLDALEEAARGERLRRLPGFGEKTEAKILRGLEHLRAHAGRYLLRDADLLAASVLKGLGVRERVRAVVAGSVRRRRETVEAVDILIAAPSGKRFVDALCAMDGVEEIRARDETKASVIMTTGITVHLCVVKRAEFPFALLHHTGADAHTIALGARAREKGLRLTASGLADGKKRLDCATEAEIYGRLGLAEIPPELREDLGEIVEYAAGAPIPELVTEAELRGTIHCHTTWSDGKHSLAEMAAAAGEMGATYIGIADHSGAAAYANGLTPERARDQIEEIASIGRLPGNVRILKGIEVDILPDGSLDYDDALLGRFDFVIASVHSSMRLPEDRMMQRIERAMRHPAVNILGHPTGRLLLRREEIAVDMDRVARMAVAFGVALEINAHPWRLDTDWRVIRRSRHLGVRYVIAPDAHSTADLGYTRYGIDVARKGGLTKDAILNTREADGFLAALGAMKKKSAA